MALRTGARDSAGPSSAAGGGGSGKSPAKEKATVRASTTAPEGGPRTIVGANVTPLGSVVGSIQPMVEQLEARTGVIPDKLLAGANHATLQGVRSLAQRGTEPLVSVPERMLTSSDRRDVSSQVQAWRDFMTSDEGLDASRGRSALVETVNAMLRARYGLTEFVVRGVAKTTCVLLLTALAHTLAAHGQRLMEALAS